LFVVDVCLQAFDTALSAVTTNCY